MVPAIGDVLRALVTFQLADGGLMQNIFTIIVTETVVNNWIDALSGVEEWFNDMYEEYLASMSITVASTFSELQLRDAAAGEWNTVAQRAFTDLQGTNNSDTLPSTTCPTVVAFPELPRHWGFKNLPPAVEFETTDGILSATVLADMLFFAGFYVAGRTGLTFSFDSGVYSLATETMRVFTDSIKIADVIGTRVTRKTGRGI